jgi:hypothetical protein
MMARPFGGGKAFVLWLRTVMRATVDMEPVHQGSGARDEIEEGDTKWLERQTR